MLLYVLLTLYVLLHVTYAHQFILREKMRVQAKSSIGLSVVTLAALAAVVHGQGFRGCGNGMSAIGHPGCQPCAIGT